GTAGEHWTSAFRRNNRRCGDKRGTCEERPGGSREEAATAEARARCVNHSRLVDWFYLPIESQSLQTPKQKAPTHPRAPAPPPMKLSYLMRPSAFIASCTLGRAATRSIYAFRLGQRARSMSLNLDQLTMTKQ